MSSAAQAHDADLERSPEEIATTLSEAIAHPSNTSEQLFDYSLPPGPHLRELYNALYKAIRPEYPYAPTRLARLLPRGHGKSESAGVVSPTWLILRRPDIRIAVISKTAGLAEERTSKVVDHVETWAPAFGVELPQGNTPDTELTTIANDHKEATISGYGLGSNLTGKHFDVILWDDIAEWSNQRTERQRRNVREFFKDYTKNLIDPDSVLECGGIQLMIGTRKHPQDLYQTEILTSETWDAKVATAILESDWEIVTDRDWVVRGDDGSIYDDVGELPHGVTLANNGVIPQRDITVLWPEHKPAKSLLYDIIDGDDSSAIWRRENQQDPHALAGQVFKSEWLTYVDELPKRKAAYDWFAGMDLGLIEDLQQAAERDGDYTALSLIGWDAVETRGYLTHLWRERGLSVKQAANWAERKLTGEEVAGRTADDAAEGIEVTDMLVEQNANRGVAQRLRDDSPLPAEGDTSSGSKEERIHNMSADFESSRLRIVGDPADDPWHDWEVNEWLQFPDSAHDDRLDSIEIAGRLIPSDQVTERTARSNVSHRST